MPTLWLPYDRQTIYYPVTMFSRRPRSVGRSATSFCTWVSPAYLYIYAPLAVMTQDHPLTIISAVQPRRRHANITPSVNPYDGHHTNASFHFHHVNASFHFPKHRRLISFATTPAPHFISQHANASFHLPTHIRPTLLAPGNDFALPPPPPLLLM